MLCSSREQAYYKKLRSKYKVYLEEDRRRQERNEKIFRILERIESRAAIISKKTERFQLLRRHYQAYLKRICHKQSQVQPSNIPIIEETPQRSSYDASTVRRALFGEHKEKEPDEQKVDIMQKYFQSLNGQKSKESILESVRRQNERERMPYSARTYEDNVGRDNNNSIYGTEPPNYANSIADDILNSIQSRHPNKQPNDYTRKTRQPSDIWDKVGFEFLNID